jgi:hypothetical protein
MCDLPPAHHRHGSGRAVTAQPAAQPSTMLAHALRYLEDAWSVFPVCTPVMGKKDRCLQGHKGEAKCRGPGKEPLIRWGKYQDQLPTEAEVRDWWRRWPTANIGLATGELSDVCVVDLDGDIAIAEANRRGYDPGPWVRTGRVGGRHLYCRYRPDAPTIFSKTNGIDFRGQGGYACLPPSLHHSGARYGWGEAYLRGEPLPDIPRWIDELARTNESGGPRDKVDFGRLLTDGIGEGQRDQELFRAAAKLRGADVPYDLAVKLIEWAAAACQPPFDLDQARAKVDSAYGRYAPNGVVDEMAPKIWTGPQLAAMAFDSPRWAIPDLLPAGLAILAGRPKLGKSWLALGWALDIPRPAPALRKMKVVQGETLYLALEDGPRRIQERMALMLGDTPAPVGFNVVTEWPRLNEGGLELLSEWLIEHPTARLVVIDTFKRVRPQEKGNARLYDLDYDAMAPLAELARRHNVAIVVVFHTRKGESEDPLEMVSGTLGLSGAADAVLVLRRERGQADASLFVTGRDVEEQDLALRWEKDDMLGWVLLGNAEDFRRSKERQVLVDAINLMPGIKPAELADATGKSRGAVRYLLFRMVQDGELRVRDGGYHPGFSKPPSTTPITANTPNPPTPTAPVSDSAIRGVSTVSGKCQRCGRDWGAHGARDPISCQWVAA